MIAKGAREAGRSRAKSLLHAALLAILIDVVVSRLPGRSEDGTNGHDDAVAPCPLSSDERIYLGRG
jgi:hypothetical protein